MVILLSTRGGGKKRFEFRRQDDYANKVRNDFQRMFFIADFNKHFVGRIPVKSEAFNYFTKLFTYLGPVNIQYGSATMPLCMALLTAPASSILKSKVISYLWDCLFFEYRLVKFSCKQTFTKQRRGCKIPDIVPRDF